MSDTATNPMRDAIQEAITENPVILFMKGTPDAPACGFSARTVAILQSSARSSPPSTSCPTPGSARSSPPSPTGRPSPSCSSSGELVGGCDIITEMYESGELAQTLGVEAPPAPRPSRRRSSRRR